MRLRSYGRLGRAGHFVNPLFSRALDAALREGQDLVLASFPYQAGPLVRICRHHQAPLVYDAHNVEAERFAGLGSPVLAALVRRAEAHLARHARALLAVSPEDQRAFRAVYGRTAALLPNGVDTRVFTPGPPGECLRQALHLGDGRVALYCGSFDYGPNREALDQLLRLDWPLRTPGRPDTHLLVVGRRPPRHAKGRRGVAVADEVQDVVPYLRLAHLVLAPLRRGGGTRLKIIEALACGQEVLSTRFGAAGLCGDGVPGLHLCEPWEFDTRLRALLDSSIAPAGNAGGRTRALGMDWHSLVGAIDWEQLTA